MHGTNRFFNHKGEKANDYFVEFICMYMYIKKIIKTLKKREMGLVIYLDSIVSIACSFSCVMGQFVTNNGSTQLSYVVM